VPVEPVLLGVEEAADLDVAQRVACAQRVVLEDPQRRLVSVGAGADERGLDRVGLVTGVDRRVLELGDREVVEGAARRATARLAAAAELGDGAAHVDPVTRVQRGTRVREDEDALGGRVVVVRLVVLHVEAGAAHRRHHAGDLEDDVVLVGRQVRGGLDVVDPQARDPDGRELGGVVLAGVGRVVGVVVGVASALHGDLADGADGQIALGVEHVGARVLARDVERHGGAAAGEREGVVGCRHGLAEGHGDVAVAGDLAVLVSGVGALDLGGVVAGRRRLGQRAVLRIARRAGEEVVRVVVRVADPLGPLVGHVAVDGRRGEAGALAAGARRRADAVERDAVEHKLDAGEVGRREVGDAGAVCRVGRDGARVTAARGVVGEQVRLAGGQRDARGHGDALGRVAGTAARAALQREPADRLGCRGDVADLHELVVSAEGPAHAELRDDDV
jgi:hypothetical protein